MTVSTLLDSMLDLMASPATPSNEEAQWQAVLTRDSHFNGAFVYAVRSTGIYCRPTCPSRKPGRQQVGRLVMLRFSHNADLPTDLFDGAALLHEGQQVGTVTSVSQTPTTGKMVGLGYVRSAAATIGARLELAEPASGWAEIADLPQLFGPGEG